VRHCSQYVRMNGDQSLSEKIETDSQDQHGYSEESEVDEDKDSIEHGSSHVRSMGDKKTEEVLGVEEKVSESLNMTLSEQLFRLKEYFLDKIKTAPLEKRNKFFKVQEEDLPPTIKGLPVHPIVENNLEAFTSEIKQGKGKRKEKGIRMENTTG